MPKINRHIFIIQNNENPSLWQLYYSRNMLSRDTGDFETDFQKKLAPFLSLVGKLGICTILEDK